MLEVNLNKDFFISYTSIDQPWAEWIAVELECAGYTTIIQAWDFRPGSNFVVEMDNATKIAKRTIALLSPKYFDSGYTFPEWAIAFRHDPKGEQGSLLPIRVQSCDIEGLLGPIIYIDLVSLDEKTARQRLLEGVRRERIKPQSVLFPLAQATASPHLSFPGALPPIWNIPYPRNLYFTGHEELLKQLATTLRATQTSVLPKPLAISGLGGMGKTQLALEYAYQYHQDYQAVFWVQADSHEALITGFAGIAELLNLPEKDTQEQAKVVIAVQQWLRVQTKWLLILNNADDLKMVSDFIPPAVGGHLILTTRAHTIGHLAQHIEIDGLNPEQGALLLLRRSGLIPIHALMEDIPYENAKFAKEITEEMGGLPLAIDQAGAYIEEVSCTLSEYKYLYQTQRTYLLKERGESIVNDHPEPVATTWSLSFKNIEKTNPAAVDLLRLCAFFYPDNIPEELIRGGGALLGPTLEKVVSNQLVFNKAISTLLNHSLLHRHQQEQTFSIHRLVQAVLQDEMEEAMQQEWIERAIKIISKAFPIPHDENTLHQCQRLLIQAFIGIHLSKRWNSTSPEVAYLLHGIATYFQVQGNDANAVPFYLQAIQVSEMIQGVNHSDTATFLSNLAGSYLGLYQYKKAENVLKRAIKISTEKLGPMHHFTRGSLTNLAITYMKQKKYKKAEALLRTSRQEPELDQAAKASLLFNLAIIYTEQGKYKKAELFYKQAHQLWSKALGPTHPTVAYTLANLAEIYQEQNRVGEAVVLYKKALLILQQQLGLQHPNTIDMLFKYETIIRNWNKSYRSYLGKTNLRMDILRQKGNYAQSITHRWFWE